MKTFIFFIAILTVYNWFPYKAIAAETPNIESEAAIVMDAKTGEVLYGKNPHARMYPASLTKVATAIYALEIGNLGDIVTVSNNARQVEGTRVYLEEGEKVQLRKLVQGLLINSGNDAGVAIAEHLDGSIEKFAENLNEYLTKIGIRNTNFENPHGLFDPKHLTTAEDLAIITKYAMKNEEFMEIFGTKELDWDGESWDTILFTHHKLMREKPYEGVTGGKTGYIDQSGHTLLTTAERDNTSLIVITLGGTSQEVAYKDTTTLLEYAFLHYKTTTIPKGTTFNSVGSLYTITEDYYFTQPLEQNVTKVLNANGTLEILNENSVLLSSIRLKNLNVEKNEGGETDTKKVESAKENDERLEGYLPSFTFFSLVALSIFFLKHTRRKYGR